MDISVCGRCDSVPGTFLSVNEGLSGPVCGLAWRAESMRCMVQPIVKPVLHKQPHRTRRQSNASLVHTCRNSTNASTRTPRVRAHTSARNTQHRQRLETKLVGTTTLKTFDLVTSAQCSNQTSCNRIRSSSSSTRGICVSLDKQRQCAAGGKVLVLIRADNAVVLPLI